MAPQILHVLLCVSCKTFQVHIVKKSNKWECKICGTKQTVLQEYGRGSGSDCRILVQKLNEARGQLEASKTEQVVTANSNPVGIEETGEDENSHKVEDQDDASDTSESAGQEKPSGWAVYLEDEDSTSYLY